MRAPLSRRISNAVEQSFRQWWRTPLAFWLTQGFWISDASGVDKRRNAEWRLSEEAGKGHREKYRNGQMAEASGVRVQGTSGRRRNRREIERARVRGAQGLAKRISGMARDEGAIGRVDGKCSGELLEKEELTTSSLAHLCGFGFRSLHPPPSPSSCAFLSVPVLRESLPFSRPTSVCGRACE